MYSHTFRMISTALDLNSCWRKPFRVDLTDISKREFTLAILFCLNYALLTMMWIMFSYSEIANQSDCLKHQDHWVSIDLKTINKIVYFNRPHPRNNPVDPPIYIFSLISMIRSLYCYQGHSSVVLFSNHRRCRSQPDSKVSSREYGLLRYRSRLVPAWGPQVYL